ncbi:MAG: hypothetical protein ACREJO_05005 [Phycisphaerales bacterium]
MIQQNKIHAPRSVPLTGIAGTCLVVAATLWSAGPMAAFAQTPAPAPAPTQPTPTTQPAPSTQPVTSPAPQPSPTNPSPSNQPSPSTAPANQPPKPLDPNAPNQNPNNAPPAINPNQPIPSPTPDPNDPNLTPAQRELLRRTSLRPVTFQSPQAEARFNEIGQRLVRMEQKFERSNQDQLKRLGEIRTMPAERQGAALMDLFQQILQERAEMTRYMQQSRMMWNGELMDSSVTQPTDARNPRQVQPTTTQPATTQPSTTQPGTGRTTQPPATQPAPR